MSLFKLPEGVARVIDRIQASFLWGGSNLKRKIHLVKWEEVTKSKKQGGLGVRKVRDLNDCLLAKWWWRFATEITALWRRTICYKYGISGGGWFPSQNLETKYSRTWLDILQVADSNHNLKDFYVANSEVIVGNSNRVKFWIDVWVGTRAFLEVYPILYNLSIDKISSLKDCIERKGNSVGWNLRFRRSLFAWEVEEVQSLYILLNATIPVLSNNEDWLKWKASSSGKFLVPTLYKRSDSTTGMDSHLIDLIWSNISPPNVQFLGWLVWKGRIKTASYLQQLGVLEAKVSNLCIFCNTDVETFDHVLMGCSLIWKVWSHLMNWWGIYWAILGSFLGLLEWWTGFQYKKLEARLWKALLLVVVWSIWKHRNECKFTNAQPNFGELQELIKVRVALWIRNKVAGICYSVQDFVSHIQQIRTPSKDI